VGLDRSPDRPLTQAPDSDFIHAIAHSVDLEPVEKQALLELESLRQRAAALVELVEMRLLANSPGGSQRPQ
jgi:hypothetical protein